MSMQEEKGDNKPEYRQNQKDSYGDHPKMVKGLTKNSLHSWRPPTPPPSTEECNQETYQLWNVNKIWNSGKFHQRLCDGDNDNENRLHTSSSHQNLDLLVDEPLDSLLLTENDTEVHSTCFMSKPGKRGQHEISKMPTSSQDPKQDQRYSLDNISTKYNLMKSQQNDNTSSFSIGQSENDVSFFYSGMDDLEARGQNAPNWNRARNLQQQYTEYFDHALRREFVVAHSLLNAAITRKNSNDDEDVSDPDEDVEDDYIDFSTLFTFKCSPTSRHRERREKNLPAIADIRKSSLSYIYKGRVQMRLPTDNIRLAMDECLEPGILIVEKFQDPPSVQGRISEDRGTFSFNEEAIDTKDCCSTEKNGLHDTQSVLNLNCDMTSTAGVSKKEDDAYDVDEQDIEPLKYILTVDQNIYKRLFADISSSRMPCGLYYCCHDAVDHSKNVNIGVAVAILSVVFILMFAATCVWPLD